jgi:CspA family cold shock protein
MLWTWIVAAGAGMTMVTGRVIRFDETKGYGFIAPSDGGEDVFVHANEITDRGLRVAAGTRVEFRVLEGERGMKAYDVRILEDPQAAGGAGGSGGAAAAVGGGQEAVHHERRQPADDELAEVFTEQEFSQQITDLLLATAPQLTGAVIVELRGGLVQFARKNGWVE